MPGTILGVGDTAVSIKKTDIKVVLCRGLK